MKAIQHPLLVMPLWLAVGVALVATSMRPALALAGATAWPAVEYAAHRFLMHGLARVSPRLYKRVHGVHHLYPRDLSHFMIPLAFSALVVAALSLVMPRPALGGLLLAYVAYDLAHLAAHGLIPFPFRRALARHHAKHHRDPAICFGVTSPLFDVVLGTRGRS